MPASMEEPILQEPKSRFCNLTSIFTILTYLLRMKSVTCKTTIHDLVPVAMQPSLWSNRSGPLSCKPFGLSQLRDISSYTPTLFLEQYVSNYCSLKLTVFIFIIIYESAPLIRWRSIAIPGSYWSNISFSDP